MQGLGWVALEELKWGDADHKWIKPGVSYTCGPGTYKLPSVSDIPLKFNVALLKVVFILTIMHIYTASLILKAKEWFMQGSPNVKAIHSSKAVGEPPFFLASSVFFGIKDAIAAARSECGLTEWFPLDTPATPERIRMACIDEFTKPFASLTFNPKLSV